MNRPRPSSAYGSPSDHHHPHISPHARSPVVKGQDPGHAGSKDGHSASRDTDTGSHRRSQYLSRPSQGTSIPSLRSPPSAVDVVTRTAVRRDSVFSMSGTAPHKHPHPLGATTAHASGTNPVAERANKREIGTMGGAGDEGTRDAGAREAGDCTRGTWSERSTSPHSRWDTENGVADGVSSP